MINKGAQGRPLLRRRQFNTYQVHDRVTHLAIQEENTLGRGNKYMGQAHTCRI